MERRTRRRMTVGAFAAVLAITAFVPSFAFAQGNLVNDLLKGLLGGGGGGGTTLPSGDAGGGAVTPAGGVPGPDSDYQPPLHGANPHGQGTVAVVDLTPDDVVPQPSDPVDGSEDVVIGDTQGEQNGDAYHGRATALYVDLLGIVNTDQLLPGVLSIETNEGESKDGALQPLNDLLDDVCAASGNLVCATVADMHSETNANGSTNSFELVGADVSLLGAPVLSVDVAESHGNISDDGVCQTAHGDSSVASVTVLGLNADALQSSSTSTACNNGTPSSVTNDSETLNLLGLALPIPAAGCPGPNETPNTEFDLLGLVGTVCNADDTNTNQTSSPYGIREALGVFVLPIVNLLKVSVGGPESHAVAPTPTTPPANPPTDDGGGGAKGQQGAGGDDGGDDGGDGGDGGGPATTTAQPGGGELAFTGSNLIVLGLIGGALLLGGVALAGSARHRRATT